MDGDSGIGRIGVDIGLICLKMNVVDASGKADGIGLAFAAVAVGFNGIIAGIGGFNIRLGGGTEDGRRIFVPLQASGEIADD